MNLITSLLELKKTPYYPTEADTLMWFHIINNCVFDRQLIPFENIVIKRICYFWALVTYDDEIKNSPLDLHMHMKFPYKWAFVNVLAHEMVHKWQLEIIHDTANHNKHFFSWRPKFKESGLDLNRKA